MTTLSAKTFFHSLFSLGWVESVSSSPTEQSALCCCSFTKGDCCLFEAVRVTHQFMSIQVCPPWQSCQGDWGQSQMGSLTHKPRGRKHFGMWVVCLEPWKRATSNLPVMWWRVAGLSSSPTVSERQNPRGWLAASRRKFVFNKLAQPEILLTDPLNIQKGLLMSARLSDACLSACRRYMKHKRDDGAEKQDEETVDVTPIMICVFVVMCCSMLVLLYFFYDRLGTTDTHAQRCFLSQILRDVSPWDHWWFQPSLHSLLLCGEWFASSVGL